MLTLKGLHVFYRVDWFNSMGSMRKRVFILYYAIPLVRVCTLDVFPIRNPRIGKNRARVGLIIRFHL